MILRGGDIELELTPRGGCVAALTWRGIDVLRRGAADAEALQQGAFPMAPFSGRIGSGRFVFAGRQIELPKNFPPEPHAIHGFSWTATWSSAAISERSQRLTHDYDGADWPWPYRAEQVFSLIEDGLELSLSLQNSSADEMPAGFGWHPYFPSDGAEIEADVREIWPSGDSMIPAEPELLSAPTDLRRARAVAGLDLDDCFTAGPGGARIAWPERGVALSISASAVFGHLVVFTPGDADVFCVEPVSHIPDAANSSRPSEETGWRVLAPGETLFGTVRLRFEEL